MKYAYLSANLSLPLLAAVVGFALSLRQEPLTGGLLLSHFVWGFLFYAAPHLLWAALSAVVKPTSVVRHAGFVAASAALLLVGALSIWGSRDPSGLPYQWLAYWPLAGLLLVVVVFGWLLAGRPRADT